MSYVTPVKTATNWPGKFVKKIPGAQYPYEFRCPAPFCFYVIVAPDEATLDQRIENHTCPWFGGGTTTYSWGVMSDSYIGPIWQMLDAEVDIIKNDTDTEQLSRDARVAARYRARGLAEALAVLMPPFFTTADDIVREAIKRWEARQAGEEMKTPGLGRLKWKRPDMEHDPDRPSWLTQQHEKEYDAEQALKVAKWKHAATDNTRKANPARHSLDATTVATIKTSTSFPRELLATAYGVDENVIQYIWDN